MRYLKWLFLSLIIILVIIVIVISLKTEEKVVKTENNVKKESITFDDKVIENVNFHDIYINKSDEYYIFTANITNLTADSLNINNAEVEVIDSNNKVITTLIGYFGGRLNGDETKSIVIKTKENLSKAKEINFNLQE